MRKSLLYWTFVVTAALGLSVAAALVSRHLGGRTDAAFEVALLPRTVSKATRNAFELVMNFRNVHRPEVRAGASIAIYDNSGRDLFIDLRVLTESLNRTHPLTVTGVDDPLWEQLQTALAAAEGFIDADLYDVIQMRRFDGPFTFLVGGVSECSVVFKKSSTRPPKATEVKTRLIVLPSTTPGPYRVHIPSGLFCELPSFLSRDLELIVEE